MIQLIALAATGVGGTERARVRLNSWKDNTTPPERTSRGRARTVAAGSLR
jgi:hypothetical protein